MAFIHPDAPVDSGVKDGLAYAILHLANGTQETFQREVQGSGLDELEVMRRVTQQAATRWREISEAETQQAQNDAMASGVLQALAGSSDEVSAAIYKHYKRGEELAKKGE